MAQGRAIMAEAAIDPAAAPAQIRPMLASPRARPALNEALAGFACLRCEACYPVADHVEGCPRCLADGTLPTDRLRSRQPVQPCGSAARRRKAALGIVTAATPMTTNTRPSHTVAFKRSPRTMAPIATPIGTRR